MADVHDVAVVGGGAMGAWTAVRLAKAGKRVILLEQFECGHERGSSHGDGRVYRRGYQESRYIAMMTISEPLWGELETFANETLAHHCGFLLIGSTDEREDPNLCGFIDAYTRHNIEHTILSPEECAKRFPQFRVPTNAHAVFSPKGGVLLASKCIRALWSYARSVGVETVDNLRVCGIQRHDSMLILSAPDGRRVCCKRAVFAPGAWLQQVCADMFDVRIDTRVTAETVSYYEANDEDETDHSPRAMPAYFVQTKTAVSSLGVYGTPDVGAGVKAAAHYAGYEVRDVEKRPLAAGGEGGSDGRVASRAEDERDAEDVTLRHALANDDFVRDTLPHLRPCATAKVSCLYTSTRDHDFVISYVPRWDRDVVLVGGGSGHAFKMAPAIGACAAALVSGDDPPVDVAPFQLERLIGKSYDVDSASMH